MYQLMEAPLNGKTCCCCVCCCWLLLLPLLLAPFVLMLLSSIVAVVVAVCASDFDATTLAVAEECEVDLYATELMPTN